MSSASSGSESDSSLDSNYGRKVKGAAKKKARRAGKAAEGPAEAADAGDLTLFGAIQVFMSRAMQDVTVHAFFV